MTELSFLLKGPQVPPLAWLGSSGSQELLVSGFSDGGRKL